MLINYVVPVLRSVPLGLVSAPSAFADIKNFAVAGSAVQIDEKIHSEIILQPPLPWLTAVNPSF
jgi:hypothetical protein